MENRDMMLEQIQYNIERKVLQKGYSCDISYVLKNAMEVIYDAKLGGACLLMSVIEDLALKYFGHESTLVLGLAISQRNMIFFHHAWLEINNKVCDVAIYGNTTFNEGWKGKNINPQILETYEDADIAYLPYCFINSKWQIDPLYTAVGKTYYEYITKGKEWGLVSILTGVSKDSEEWQRIVEISKNQLIRAKRIC